MKLVIDIPFEAYYTFKCDLGKGNLNALAEIVANGKPYEPIGDLISREALKKHALEMEQANGVEIEPIMVVPLSAIDNAPPVDAIVNTIEVRQQGEWIDKGHGRYECSVCGHFPATQNGFPWLSSFCPECGADMRGGATNEKA